MLLFLKRVQNFKPNMFLQNPSLYDTFCFLDPQECRQNEQEVKVQMRESSRPLIALRETKGGSSNKKDLLNTPGLHLQMTQKSLTRSNQNLWIIKFADVFIL